MIALGPWLRKHADKIVKIYLTRTLPSERNNVAGVLRMLKNSGWDYTYLKIWINKLAPFFLRGRHVPASVDDYVRAFNLAIPVQEVPSVNDVKVIEEIESLGAELLISFSATQKFEAGLLNAPRIGAINVHYGQLPDYAGLSPYFWHLYNRERYYGVTLHKIVPKLDAGPIVDQVVREIGDTRSALDLLLKMAEEVSPLLIRFFEGEKGFDKMLEQDLKKRRYFRHPDRKQIAQFKRNGFATMDKLSKKRVYEKVRCICDA
jgi:hypothetical protein